MPPPGAPDPAGLLAREQVGSRLWRPRSRLQPPRKRASSHCRLATVACPGQRTRQALPLKRLRLAARVDLFKRDDDFYLRNVHGKAQLALARGGDFDTLVGELLTSHDDPLYLRSQGKHYTQAQQPLAVPALDDATLTTVAQPLLQG